MGEVKRQQQRWLEAARRHQGPSPAAVKRMRQGLRARILAGEAAPSVVAEPDGNIASAYFDMSRKTAARLARQKKDYASKFPNIKVENS